VPYIRYAEKEGTGILRFDRQEAANALSTPMIDETLAFFEGLGKTGLHALILTGEGKTFIAGADIREMAAMGAREATRFSELGNRLMTAIETCPVPVLAVLNGHAIGGGLEVALAADFIYASAAAKLGFPEVTLGLIPGFGGVGRLCARIGTARAKELIFTGGLLSAQEAFDLGIVNRVAQSEKELMARALETAALIGAAGREAIRAAKLHAMACTAAPPTKLREAELFGSLFAGHEAREGLSAHLEKRRPRWTGQDVKP
jgi:enoyl-CoA hydratase